MSYNKITALTANVRAIKLAMRLRTNGASAVQEDKAILSAYTGFGGIKEIMGISTANLMPEACRIIRKDFCN